MKTMINLTPVDDDTLVFQNKFLTMAALSGIVVDERQLDLFSLYFRELMFWNRRMNIVSERSVEDIAERHFIDSLTALPFVGNEGSHLVDLGSGGGFPGIPLKIMRPDITALLLDSSRKKVSFLSYIITKLDLQDITAEQCRIEEALQRKARRAAFDCAVSRAAFKLDVLVRFSSRLLKQGGLLVAMKGPELDEEERAAEDAARQTGLEPLSDPRHALSIPNSNRKIIIYKSVRLPLS